MVREFLDYKIVIGTTNSDEEAIERQTNIVVVIPLQYITNEDTAQNS
jgi:hypothetical protein